MPYKKTKDGSLVNEVTLGDGYPLSNDLQPLKVGGKASPIEMSTSLPDDSNNAKVKVRGDLEVTGGLNFKNDVEVDLSFDDLSLSGNLDVAGSVGIGTTSPSTKLEVDGTITATSIDAGTIYNTSLAIGRDSTDQIDFSSDNQIRFKVGNANEIILNVNSLYPAVNDGTALGGTSNNYSDLYLASGGTINWNNGDIVATHSSNALGITGGNVGIGTSSPDSNLHISYSDDSPEGDLKNNFNDVGLQVENTHADGCASIQLRSSDADGYIFYDRTGSNAGDMHFRTDGMDSLSSLTLKDDGKVGVGIEAPTTTLDVEGTVSYKHTAFTTAGPTDNVDVSDTTVLEVDTSSNNVTIGGFTGGVQGQILYIVKTDTANFIQLEHNEGGGSQDIFLTSGSDDRVVGYGGFTLYCNGTSWFSLSNPTGAADAG